MNLKPSNAVRHRLPGYALTQLYWHIGHRTFPDAQILSTVQRELSWSHLKTLIYIDDPLKRDFYLEVWPEETIRQDLSVLREQGQLSPDLTSPCSRRAKPCRPSCTSPSNWPG